MKSKKKKEITIRSSDAEKEHMGLATWKNAPNGKSQKFDVTVAKNYLLEPEMGQLEWMGVTGSE